MNNVYRDQLARKLSAAFTVKSGWSDVNGAVCALEWLTAYLEGHLAKCLNYDGIICDISWKHEDCEKLMAILYDITQDEKYKGIGKISSPWD